MPSVDTSVEVIARALGGVPGRIKLIGSIGVLIVLIVLGVIGLRAYFVELPDRYPPDLENAMFWHAQTLPRDATLVLITADELPATAQQVFDGYLAFISTVRAMLPGLPMYYISITPTPLRWKYWSIVQEANRLIQTHTLTDPALHYIDITGAFLGPDGLPDRRLFRPDRLHPNARGYEQWTALIKPLLLADFPPRSESVVTTSVVA